MLEELNELIKADKESQTKFESFKALFYEERELLAKSALKRARVTALVLGAVTVMSLLFLLFAFVTKTKAEEEVVKYEAQIQALETKLENCAQ